MSNSTSVWQTQGKEVSSENDMAQWVQRDYSKSEIDRAAAVLTSWWKGKTIDRLGHYFMIVENWRTSHAYPLNAFQNNLRSRSRRVEDGVIVAQRLKRFISTMNKLTREPNMKLSQMQDLGGCRAILSSTDSVESLLALYRGKRGLLFDSESALKCYDYIRNPKPDGYRGIHIIGRYIARSESHERWNHQRIEIQLRSRLQHAFATAVETVTTFTREPLKFGAGPTEWRRFFALMGSVLALREGTPLVADTPHNEENLVRELKTTARALRVKQRLRGWATALRRIPRQNIKGFKWLLLVLDLKENTIRVVGYSNRKKGLEALGQIEQDLNIRDNLDAVLVGVNSAQYLRTAYPNYYADTTEFLTALDHALSA